MAVHWIRAFHSELQREVVMPLEALAHHSGWEQVGESSTDPEALRAELARDEAVCAAEAASAADVQPAPTPTPTPAPKSDATTPESSAPSGADQKEK